MNYISPLDNILKNQHFMAFMNFSILQAKLISDQQPLTYLKMLNANPGKFYQVSKFQIEGMNHQRWLAFQGEVTNLKLVLFQELSWY